MLNQFNEIDGSAQGAARNSPNRMSRGRFSPENGGHRGTLAYAVGGRASRQSPYGGSRATFSRAGGGSRAGSVRENPS
jgi:hypothetical protein